MHLTCPSLPFLPLPLLLTGVPFSPPSSDKKSTTLIHLLSFLSFSSSSPLSHVHAITDTPSYRYATAIQCPEIQSNDPNLQIWSQDRNFSATASFSCPDGFNLQGAASVTCNSNGSWSNLIPYCEGQCLRYVLLGICIRCCLSHLSQSDPSPISRTGEKVFLL